MSHYFRVKKKNQKTLSKKGNLPEKLYHIQELPTDSHFYSPYSQGSWRYSKHFRQKCLESPRPLADILQYTEKRGQK